MSTYKQIYGQNIEFLSSDPSNPTLGQIWYNTSTNKLKGFRAVASGVWSTGGNLNNGGSQGGAAAGTYNAALAIGGGNPSLSPSQVSPTEKYNGTSWASGDAMVLPRKNLAAFGSQTAALAFGGYSSPPFQYRLDTETYNGSSWATSPGSLPGTKNTSMAFGAQTAGVQSGGGSTPTSKNLTEIWNGSSWTANPTSLNTPRSNGSACGTQTAGLVFAGTNAPDYWNGAEKFNGSTYSATGTMGTARYSLAGFGSQTAAIAASGGFPASGLTEQFNGSTWAAKNNMGVATYSRRGAGNATNGVVWGGTQGLGAATEEWNPEDDIAIF